MACNAQSLIAQAMANGYAGMSERDLKEATVAAACAGSGGGGNNQIVTYISDPNTEGVLPGNPLQPAIAYPVGGGTTFQWTTPAGPWV